MIKKFSLLFVIGSIALTTVAATSADIRKPNPAKARQTSSLVALLPASDAVVVFENRRFLTTALPQLLAANSGMLSQVNSKIAEMEAKTGIDLRKFDQVAVGIKMKQVSAKEIDYEPLVIASGDINAGALIAVGKLAANGTYREEKVGNKTLYVFNGKELAAKKAPNAGANSKLASKIGGILDRLNRDIAVTSLDGRTLAMGTLSAVRGMLTAKSNVGTDLTSLLNANTSSVGAFAARMPAGGISRMVSLDNDELGAQLDAIQYLAGSLDVAGTGATVRLLARTKQPQQAKSLHETVEGLQMLGGALLGANRGPDKQVYARMIKAAKFAHAGSDVTLELTVPQSDIDVLIGGLK
jgi:hypothetical protein